MSARRKVCESGKENGGRNTAQHGGNSVTCSSQFRAAEDCSLTAIPLRPRQRAPPAFVCSTDTRYCFPQRSKSQSAKALQRKHRTAIAVCSKRPRGETCLDVWIRVDSLLRPPLNVPA